MLKHAWTIFETLGLFSVVAVYETVGGQAAAFTRGQDAIQGGNEPVVRLQHSLR